MANLITVDYFIREINLPGNVLEGELADITPYITQYERLALISLLGYPLYKSLKVGIDAGDPYEEVRWKRLITGHEYTVTYQGAETTVKWNGLINSEIRSLLAYFIFYYYLKFHSTITSSRGSLLANSENAQAFAPGQAMVNAWGFGLDLYGKTTDDLVTPTAFNFLDKFKDDETDGYDGWIFTHLGSLNTFSL
jgi:hypothetical protein